ncbi:periplasmic heavy metal sensor [Sphingomonas sp. PAMC 26621]|uniref:periplasmic heavy metal sensor n=1 Tax=Sphingomonas sp. PAMC 26621 TaxID=1112213 RepID=UPI0002898384|nr:periplasmic heavy metal sensor [Sphingomonas sp. PAMC 26621]
MGKIRIALIVSVVLNLFLAGALVAGVVSLRTGGRMINAGSLRIAGAELPRFERRPFRAALRRARQELRPTIVEARKAKAEAAVLLRQPTVDQAAVLTALDRARAADQAVRAAVERRAVAYAATLPPADRAKLADAMKRRSDRIPPAPE